MNVTKTGGRRRQRPIPDDFAEQFAVLGFTELRAHYGAGDVALNRWRDQLGLKSHPRGPRFVPAEIPPPPADFAAVAPTMYRKDLIARYRVRGQTINHWLDLLGIETPKYTAAPPPPQKIPAPADLAQQAARMTRHQLSLHYGHARLTVDRWLAEAGLIAKRPGSVKNRYGNLTLSRSTTIYDDAADTLRRHCAVYRCTDTGKADPQGKLWRMGNSVLTPDELLYRAERKAA